MHPSTKGPDFMTDSHMMTELEPSDGWKANLKRRIEGELAFMVKDAKDQLEESIRRSPNDRNRLLAEHQTTMANIRRLAEEQFREELGRERQERRWAAGMSLENNWMESLREEQGVIYQQIKQSDSRESAPAVHRSTVRPSPQSGPDSDTVCRPTAGGSKRATPSPQPPERWVPPSNRDLDSEVPTSLRSSKTRLVGESLGVQMPRLKRAASGLRVGEDSESAGTPGKPAVVGVPELTEKLKTTLKSRIHDDIGALVQLSTEWFEENVSRVEGDDEQQLRSEVEEIKRALAVLRNLASEMFNGDGATVPVTTVETKSKEEQPAVVDLAESDGSVDERSALAHGQVPEAREKREMELGRRQGEISREIEPEWDAEEPAKEENDNKEVVRSQLEKLKGELARKPKNGRPGAVMLQGKATGLELDDPNQAESQPLKEPERILNMEEERRKREWHEQQEKMRRRAEEIERRVAGGENKRQGYGAWTTSKLPLSNAHNYLVPRARSSTVTAGAGEINSTPAMINPPRSNATGPNKPRTGSFGSSFPPPGTSGSGNILQSRAEWTRRQAEFTRQQQDRFRQEQELLARREADRMARRRN